MKKKRKSKYAALLPRGSGRMLALRAFRAYQQLCHALETVGSRRYRRRRERRWKMWTRVAERVSKRHVAELNRRMKTRVRREISAAYSCGANLPRTSEPPFPQPPIL